MKRVKRKKNTNTKSFYISNADLLAEIIESKRLYAQSNQHDKTPSQFMTPKLVDMLTQLVERYSSAPNWKNYTYLDELKAEAIVNLCEKWDMFDENHENPNPFSYYTTIITNSFRGQLTREKRPQKVKDSILKDMGLNPSYSTQIEDEIEWRKQNADKLKQPKRGWGRRKKTTDDTSSDTSGNISEKGEEKA